MEIDYKLVRELTHDLEMNGRQFIARDRLIQQMKADGTYDVKHGQDLIYFHVVSGMINSIIEKIFMYLEYKTVNEGLESAFRGLVEKEYNEYKEYYNHCDFLSAMDRKYGLNLL
ncbi:hypothetical protein pEaSNUABM50_00401 [Erwinia phage pEa_SNUABM_50]|uniref:Uncharacterized protein n=4 Tax=Eneladusvirus BF TaxID=2560751 RepID=A0A7L8ZNV5_9CAUD|nr:hypothetical protein FDH34_gp519 [Serratia phage BF]QOI71340.1 hypothetical protein pEaSNUABM12_00407 [Erwinia phage pEa_SNUABM_12]QOI71882.1 hypothetical protein pEaSNUABM47_00403 [Erwinia phage pEa_SNUABM_47]QOI72421.1 hypothetical protein pEaSNUABM50_00401 [Erwinia phage pEa_SNUABM_50]QXO11548.1 hypothetical protein pEaSNUABM19_00407 [Erwinia phage pEa_SNUABM_19]QXO12096.1 hypothetical protein pEaSNUABM44_00405 [Erwinia phage pEa_SNUABM_44]QXO12649.1 hypothetical protein pEaSNUABM49_004